MGGTKCLRLGTCELECMGGVLQNDSSIIPTASKTNPTTVLRTSIVEASSFQPRAWDGAPAAPRESLFAIVIARAAREETNEVTCAR